MTTRPRKKAQDAKQSQRFIETARQIEADESGERFEQAFRVLVPPKKPVPKGRKRRTKDAE